MSDLAVLRILLREVASTSAVMRNLPDDQGDRLLMIIEGPQNWSMEDAHYVLNCLREAHDTLYGG
jgi:hypothetical protein